MASYDNEIYRGPPEAGPTLEHDIRSYGSDVYIVKSEITTLKQDVPPTEEPIRQESKPVQKKESKIAKAMKLLASCTAAVAIAVNLTAPAPPPPIQKPESNLPEWPQYNYIDENLNGYSVNAISQHSNVAQASTGSKTYRITAKQEGLHLFWNDTYNIDHNPNREAFCLIMYNLNEGWFLDVSFHLYPQTDTWSEYELLSQFTTESGETFYLRTSLTDESESTKERAADILSRLSDYIEISEATDDGWGKVLIGETMISDTNSHWNGILTTPEISTDFCFSRINQKQYADYTEDQFIRSLTINDIDWSFYYSFDEYSLLLWAVPAQEDIALASGLDFILNDLGLTIDELQSDSKEVQAVLTEYLNLAVELAADICFSNYHLYDNPNPSPIHPVNPPDVPDETATVPAPDTGIEDYTYWSGSDFHFAGRSFIMEAMREDAMFREIYKGEDNIQFDVRVDYDNIRILVIISDAPNGAEYYPYVLDNGQELYVAAFNYWDNTRILDEATLHTLARDFAFYFKITETTEPEETGPIANDDPYSYLPEYTQYIVDSSGMSYSPFARSNRVCHFSTNGGNYRLESQSPDLFMLWENYYYDMKEESANSYITLQNIAESWSMGVWVFDEQVESVYDCFTLTTEDGTTLWFYIANFDDFSQQNPLEAVLSKLPDQIHLAHAEEGNWTKVLYGQSLIVDVTSSWSGLAYTASNDDFWYFDQMISVNDLQYYNLRFADSRTVNGTTWEFYTTGGSNGYGITEGKEFYHTQVFAVPTGGDVCFTTTLYNGLTLDQNEFSNQTEYEAYIDANVHLAIDTIVRQGLSNFYSYQSPDNGPSDPTDPISPTFTEEYFTDLSFSFEGRSFRMDALRNDVSFRQIHQGEDHVQFDFRADDENLRVQLIIGSSPNGAEYYPYYLTNGTEIYVAAFNCWGEPWIADEQTLAALAQNLSAYVYIDESTEWFDLDKAAYDWIGEYSFYDSTPDGDLTHTCYAWSNRTCQFNVNSSVYRLESLTPEVFICWDDFSYDTESQSGASQIRIYHLTEAWNLGTWVSDDPEHLASADFSLTMEDGTQLWFYVWHYYAPADPLQDIIQRIENYVKLSPPREDGWNKVRIGRTMISDMNMQWNGLTSTVGTSWRIEAILSRETAAEDTPQFIETRTVNGITWNFYHSGPGTVYAVPQQEDIWLKIPSQFVLNIDLRQFRNGRELFDYYNANISSAIDRIVNEGLIYYHLYP